MESIRPLALREFSLEIGEPSLRVLDCFLHIRGRHKAKNFLFPFLDAHVGAGTFQHGVHAVAQDLPVGAGVQSFPDDGIDVRPFWQPQFLNDGFSVVNASYSLRFGVPDAIGQIPR